jgi:hypothetical protein
MFVAIAVALPLADIPRAFVVEADGESFAELDEPGEIENLIGVCGDKFVGCGKDR